LDLANLQAAAALRGLHEGRNLSAKFDAVVEEVTRRRRSLDRPC
jgi:hypothetical protein